ncbi:MAG: GTP-binding protein, partial [Clostridia bacterium]|nr:GTP-binding protein [Clostridia bacterium]
GGFMKDAGIQVTELNSGCICCTMVGDFSDALKELINNYHPDRIIIEPSGVGKLSDIRRVVTDLMAEYEITLEGSATVADVNKCRMYARNFGEFFIDQIETAETIILSRTQTASEDRIEKCIELLRQYNAEARIITTPWDELTPAQMLEVIESAKALISTEEALHEHHHHHHHDHECECGHDHEHHHHHEHGEGCSCGCGHDHHGHHHADEVFQNVGVETHKKFTEAQIREALEALDDDKTYGAVLRAKGIVPTAEGEWLHFDYVPGEYEIRRGSADYTGRLCVIGAGIHEDKIRELFGI